MHLNHVLNIHPLFFILTKGYFIKRYRISLSCRIRRIYKILSFNFYKPLPKLLI
jgi:hypothetical protein